MSDILHLQIFLIYVCQTTLQISAQISGNFSTKNNLFLSFNILFCSPNQTSYYRFVHILLHNYMQLNLSNRSRLFKRINNVSDLIDRDIDFDQWEFGVVWATRMFFFLCCLQSLISLPFPHPRAGV